MSLGDGEGLGLGLGLGLGKGEEVEDADGDEDEEWMGQKDVDKQYHLPITSSDWKYNQWNTTGRVNIIWWNMKYDQES